MSDRQTILLVDDDPVITEALALTLERPGRTTIVCSDVQAAEISLMRHRVTHLVTDVQFSGDFGFEGLHFLGRVRALAPQCRIVLITGYATDALIATAKSFGASEVLAKPFDTNDLERALCAHDVQNDAPYEVVRFPSLDEILINDELVAAFQPILRMTPDGVAPFGYEALARVRGQWLTGGPAMLFDYAERRAQLAELNLVSIARSIEAGAQLPGEPLLFVNVDPLVFTNPKLIPTLHAASARSGVPLTRVVLEVTERSGFENDDEACRVFDELRELGLRFALDDHASAYSHLAVINRIRPSFMKISNTFGTDFEQDETRGRIVRHVVALAHDLGCETILEGIETAHTATAAAATGVDLVQGYYFGRPNPASHWKARTRTAA
ncbi:MAG TPA: EAL domain-containing response regulator [Thermoanaerobaculia bacterium]|nr:EAL domain-containing response regulator [Thermoanaerobaculia bacterium]